MYGIPTVAPNFFNVSKYTIHTRYGNRVTVGRLIARGVAATIEEGLQQIQWGWSERIDFCFLFGGFYVEDRKRHVIGELFQNKCLRINWIP